MDASRNIHQAPADSLNLHSIPSNSGHIHLHNTGNSASDFVAALRSAALALADGRINQRDQWEGRKITPERFCMECRVTQADAEAPAHLAWCNTGRVLDAIAALDDSEKIEPLDGPGVGGYTPIRGVHADSQPESYELSPGVVAQLRMDIEQAAASQDAGDFGEPWRLTEPGDDRVIDRHFRVMADPMGSELHDDDERSVMRRLAACVNACIGLSTETLEKIADACYGGAR